jgi:hypothetical protein
MIVLHELQSYFMIVFLVRRLKKEKAKNKNYSRRKKVLVASFRRRLRTPYGGEV